MTHRWKTHDRNHLTKRNDEDKQVAARARAELANLPRWRRAIPLVGEAALLRHTIETAERAIATRQELQR